MMSLVNRGSDRALAAAWIGAVIATALTAGLALELADHSIRVIQGIVYALPYRISESVRLIVLYGVLFVAPATVCRLCWSYLFRRADRELVTIALLLHILVLGVLWPSILARQLGDFFGR